MASERTDGAWAIGRSPDSLRLNEAVALAGKHVALEVYSPETTPLRRIEAIGDTAGECLAQLAAHGRDPRLFEFTILRQPY